MRTLDVIFEQTGEPLGLITLTDNGSVSADTEVAEGIFAQYRKYAASDRETFDMLASGWSNGYATIPALATA